MAAAETRIDISVRNEALREALVALLKDAGYLIALPGEAPDTTLTTESERTPADCAALVSTGSRVVVLMSSTSQRAQDAYLAAGARCLGIGEPIARVLALIEEVSAPARTLPAEPPEIPATICRAV